MQIEGNFNRGLLYQTPYFQLLIFFIELMRIILNQFERTNKKYPIIFSVVVSFCSAFLRFAYNLKIISNIFIFSVFVVCFTSKYALLLHNLNIMNHDYSHWLILIDSSIIACVYKVIKSVETRVQTRTADL